MAFRPRRQRLLGIYERLLLAYGPQHWWPGDSRFEVMVGAVLTQNTAWSNVEQAIARLKAAGCLGPEAIVDSAPATLAEALRPTGYFNVKAQRLISLCRFLIDSGGARALQGRETGELRQALLAVHGIGPETADDILLYAFERPVFVIDAYTRRLLQRLRLAGGAEGYEELRAGFERALGPDVPMYNEYHALIVHHAKVACRVRPRCEGCCLRRGCSSAGSLR